MEILYSYSNIQLEEAVQFIGTHNKYFLGAFDKIRQSILENMNDLALKFPNCEFIGTMGYYIIAEIVSEENIDEDINSIMFDITVDPAVSINKWDKNNTVTINLDTND